MRPALILFLLAMCLPACAEMNIETINLHHRTAQEVIGILKPMLDKNGSITGSGYKLFIKSTPDNIAQLRQMLSEIDVAARNLLVSVSMDPVVLQENRQISANFNVHAGQTILRTGKPANSASASDSHDHHKGRIMYDNVRLYERAKSQRNPQAQTVRVSEGLWATIKTGQAIPITSRTRNPDGTVTDTYTYQAVATGFQVLPRVDGDNVILSIRPQSQTVSADHAGAYNTTQVQTTVSGKLGQWIPLGSVAQSQQSSSTGIAYHAQQRHDESNQIFVKVELVKP